MFPFMPVGLILCVAGGWFLGTEIPNPCIGVACAALWGYFIGEIST